MFQGLFIFCFCWKKVNTLLKYTPKFIIYMYIYLKNIDISRFKLIRNAIFGLWTKYTNKLTLTRLHSAYYYIWMFATSHVDDEAFINTQTALIKLFALFVWTILYTNRLICLVLNLNLWVCLLSRPLLHQHHHHHFKTNTVGSTYIILLLFFFLIIDSATIKLSTHSLIDTRRDG